jgi:hypothetical protein
LVVLLDHPILLWRVRGSQVVLDAFLLVVIDERSGREFPTVICAEGPKLSPRLGLCLRLERHERRHGLILAAHQENPHVPAQVIDEEEEEHVAAWGRWCHRAAQITMNQFESVHHPVYSFTSE